MTTYIKFDALPAAGTLSPSDIVPIEQSGVTAKTTIAAITVASGGIPDAPNDGTPYVRQSAAWVPESSGGAVQPLIVVNAQTASYTLVLADFPTNGSIKDIQVTSSSATNVTIPPNSTVAAPVGSQIVMSAWGTGAVTFVAGAGVTIVDAFGVATTAQFDSRYARQVAANIWQIL